MTDELAELSLLGAVCISPDEVLPNVRSIVRAADILSPTIRASYEAACELADEREAVDPVTIQERARKNGTEVLNRVLREAMESVVTVANAAIYAKVVHAAAVRREVRSIGEEISRDEYGDATETLRAAISRMQELQSGSCSAVPSPSETSMKFYRELQEAAEGKAQPFLSTGYKKLDELLGGGLVKSGFITLAARPGIGKTMLGLNIAENVAAAGKSVLYVSLEMGSGQLMARRVGTLSCLSYNKLQRGDIQQGDEDTWRRIISAVTTTSTRKLYISDKPATLADVELKARAIKDLSLIVIDHMGLIRNEGRYGSRYEMITERSHALKSLALSIEIPILTLCQLNRESALRQDHQPTLADLRDSGAIEEDSDAVMLLHRPAAYFPDDQQPKPWEAQDIDVEVAKNRHGYTGKITMDFYGLTAKILER